MDASMEARYYYRCEVVLRSASLFWGERGPCAGVFGKVERRYASGFCGERSSEQGMRGKQCDLGNTESICKGLVKWR